MSRAREVGGSNHLVSISTVMCSLNPKVEVSRSNKGVPCLNDHELHQQSRKTGSPGVSCATLLIGSMNPRTCRCYGDRVTECTCSAVMSPATRNGSLARCWTMLRTLAEDMDGQANPVKPRL